MSIVSNDMGLFTSLFKPNSKDDFWGDFKLHNPSLANAIESLTGESFSFLSNKDAREKLASLERLSKNQNCSLANVKKSFIDSFISEFGNDKDIIKQAVKQSVQEIDKEALRFNIKRENTAAYYINNWLLELLS